MKGHEQLRLTADIRLRFALPKFGKAEIRMFVKRYTPRKTERYLCKLNGGDRDGEGSRAGETHKSV